MSTVTATHTNRVVANKAVVSTYFDKIINQHRVDLISEVFIDDVQLVNGKESGHLKATEGFLAVLFKAFPDMMYAVDEIVAEQDNVVARVTAKATHKGEFLGYKPLGNKIDIVEIFFFTMENGEALRGLPGYVQT